MDNVLERGKEKVIDINTSRVCCVCGGGGGPRERDLGRGSERMCH